MPVKMPGQAHDDPAQSHSLVAPSPEPYLQAAPSATSGAPTSLTIERALSLAEQNSPLLRQGAALVERAQAGIQTARAYTNPTFEYLVGHQSARPIATPGVPGLLQHYSAGQTIEIPVERRSRIRAAQLELKGNAFQLAGVRLSVMASVERAFYDVLRRKEQLANAKSNFSLVEDLRRRVGVEVQVGEKGKLELTRAEAELARARAAVNSAEVELASSRAILKAVIGIPSEENPDPQGVLDHRAQLAPLDELRRQVLETHPALSESTARTTQAQEIVAHERARRIPQPNLYGEYERQPDQTFFRFGVTVPLPLWDKRKGPIAEAQADVARSRAIGGQRKLEIMAALERAYDQYQITDQQVQGLQAGSLREAQAAVDAASSAYRFGERGIVEVLDAQRVLQGVRTDLLDALFARQSALIDLEELGAMRP
jgi:cobalt-zinc-cadmium efflux system outer membrane protein